MFRYTSKYDHDMSVYRRKILIITAIRLLVKRKYYKSRRWHVRPLLRERSVHGHYHCLTSELQLYNSALYYNFMRMNSTTFEKLVNLIGPSIQRKVNSPFCRQDVLTVGEILTATLRYLGSGESMASIVYAFRLGASTVTKLIRQCCSALWDVLNSIVLLKPTKANWLKVADGFKNQWDMPNCFSAIDGKHIVHQAFANTGSSNFNYKGSHSIILLAMCDAEYKFTLVDIGAPGRCSDGGVFKASSIGQGFSNNLMDLPEPLSIDQNTGPIPFFMVADEVFPLTEYMMRPYPGRGSNNMPLDERVFNYRLSRARRTIENTFGIFASKWRIFRRPIIGCTETVTKAITKASVVLHNFIRIEEYINEDNYSHFVSGVGDNDGCSADALVPATHLGSNTFSRNAKSMRENLKDFFNDEGAVGYQYEHL